MTKYPPRYRGWARNGTSIRYGVKIVKPTCRFQIINGWRVCTTCNQKVERINDDLQ